MEEGFNSRNHRELERLRRSVQRIRYIPYYYLDRMPPNHNVSTYKELLVALYMAIGKVSGARIIIDSSKEPPHGFLIGALSGIEAKLIHMIRDSRAVAFSMRRKRVRPEVHWKTQYMPRSGIVETSLRWNYYNICTEALCRRMRAWKRVKYEDLVASPFKVIDGLLSWLDTRDGLYSGIDPDGAVDITMNHSVAGNPSRFVTGRIQIRTDEEWRSSMSRRDRIAVMTLTFPLLARYYWTKGTDASA
jgi:hypothetical protein